MASSPRFDPAIFVDKSQASIAGLFGNPNAPLMNRATSGTYPAGSIFKIIVATAGLETKKIKPSTTFFCQGSLFVGRKEFACWNKHGAQELNGGIAHSCNVFFYHTGLLVGAQTIHDYALKFGLSHSTGFELPYEAAGFVPSPLWRKINKFKSWFDGDTANLSIGQGDVLVTPLQIARMMTVFANEGYLVNPYIVKAINGRDISVYQKKAVRLNLKTNTIENIRLGLRSVVSDPAGTGNVLNSLPVPVAGKTGTAQAPPGQPHAWFVGFFPFQNPKFVICVFLERGGPGYYSCVLAKQIIERIVGEGLL
jgi:penicillin-binding protein 2